MLAAIDHDKSQARQAVAVRPSVLNEKARQAFAAYAQSIGLNPADRWVGGYVDYEWDHLRLVFDCYGIDVVGKTVLEFGCNVGASSIIFALLGAQPVAVDISEPMVQLARLNAQQYGIGSICFHHVPDTRRLPFPDEHFDVINCNSVIEYVSPAFRSDVQRELDRVLRRSGRLLVSGSSNRLWPREVHSRMWCTNYLPRALDRILGKSFERGVSPWSVRYGFGNHYTNLDKLDGGAAYLHSRSLMGTNTSLLRAMIALSRVLGVGPGMLAPNISCVLRKDAPSKVAPATPVA